MKILVFIILLGEPTAFASLATRTAENVRYIGATTCSSSHCHGGASPMSYQFPIWSQQDFHSRSYATLLTPHSTQIVQTLKQGLDDKAKNENRTFSQDLTSALTSPSCTTCHAPLANIIADRPDLAGAKASVTEGVSCEQCHGAADFWLRGHTRPDWTYANRIEAGMKEMRSLEGRAVSCAKCHQVIDPNILEAGHPELIFELDGFSASQPRHWVDPAWYGPKAWVVGQAVALKEISQQIMDPHNLPEQQAMVDKDGSLSDAEKKDLVARQQALIWLLAQVHSVGSDNPPLGQASGLVVAWADKVIKQTATVDWDRSMSESTLKDLAGTSSSFTDANTAAGEQVLRAERLVMGIDRLQKSLLPDVVPGATPVKTTFPGKAETDDLFGKVQIRDQFNASEFSTALKKYSDALAKG